MLNLLKIRPVGA